MFKNLSTRQLLKFLLAQAFVLFAVCLAFPLSNHAQITYSFSNPGAITIPNSGAAAPYPSTINVTNVPSVISKVTVKLNSLNHTFPSDIDVLLVGPGGQTAIIMSDAGGSTAVSGITLTLDDAAANPLPNTALTTGTFRPTNITAGDTFPAPAPVPSGNSALSVFNGTNANGTWRLYVVDDVAADAGSFVNGWTLTITNAISGENPNAISIPASGVSSPYPSDLTVTDHGGLIAGVQVFLNNFTHSAPDDVDLLLVSPSGRKVVLMSDAGGNNPVSNLTLIFDDAAANSLPDSGTIIPGAYKPTNFEPGDAFPPPAPTSALTGNRLTFFNGDTPNGVWKLFLVDDNGDNAGTISGGWSIALRTETNMIVISSTGTAQPYPGEMFISSLPGSITKATVTLSNFSHTSPDDVDILLVAPNGRRIVLMSDVGGNTEVGGLNLTFDDAAGGNLPDNSPLSSGTFKPTNFEVGDEFPAPAPAGAPTGTTLNAFYGGTPNGSWKLYVVDDSGESVGSIAGNWSLNLQTSTSACLFTISPETQAFPITGGSGNFSITMPTGCPWTASTSAAFLGITSEAGGDGSGIINFSVAPNMGGGRTATIDVTNGILTRSFQVQQPSGCPFAVSQSSVSFSAAGGSGNVAVTAGGGCAWQASTVANWIQITSSPQTGDGAATFNVNPNPSANARSGVINLGLQTITVNQAGATGRRFDFDGDGKADVSLFRPSSGVWWILNSGQPGSYAAAQFGLETDKIAPADYDGDRKTDIAVYRDGVWYIFQSQSATVRIQHWGLSADVPVAADYDGDGRADLAVYRPSEGIWYVSRSTDSQYQAVNFGLSTDKAAPGDYDGDGKTDFAVYRAGATSGEPSFWAVLQSSNGAASMQQFGSGGDIPVPGDYDGDGRDNLAVFRPSNGVWYTSPNPATNFDARHWGTAGDVPATADYNGDGRTDLAVFRQGVWYILHLGTEEIRVESWGLTGDKPAPAAYLP